MQKKLADSEEVLQKVTKKANDLSAAKKNYDSLDEKIKEKISAILPDQVNVKSVIQILETAAQNHEASISALQVQPFVIDTKKDGSIKKTVSEISFTFNTEGEYKNLISLLQELKASSRLISIDNLSLSKANEGTSLIMSLSGKAYYLK